MLSDRNPTSRARPLLLMAAALALIVSAMTLAAPPRAGAAEEQLLSQGKAATASSGEGAAYTAAFAVDGDPGTRWASDWSDPQWLQVDLGQDATLTRAVLSWEGIAYGKVFEIQASADGSDWTTVATESDGSGGTQELPLNGSGRYVRMLGTERGSGYGYSLWEFEVYGTTDGSDPGGDGVVEVTGSQGNWQLTVEGEPYTVKGLTWGPSVDDAARYMPDLASMGVNTIRTWGTDATTEPLLDAAAAHGIRVILGFWLQPGGGPGSGGCVDYVNDHDYKGYQLYLMNEWVAAYQDHPGVLMWNVGNESLLGLQNCYSGAELEAQRDAYARFVNDAALEIKALDSDHPVTSTDAWTGAWPYYREHTPALDLLAVNAYDAVCDIRQTWESGGYQRPYILTEGGPAGEWEVPDDVNGVPREPTDVEKRDGYRRSWECLTGHEGVALGGTLFHYGLEDDFGGVWFNLLPGGERRLAYYEVAELYGGQPPSSTPPVITNLAVGGDRTAVAAGEEFTLSADVHEPDGDAVSYAVKVNSKYIDDSGALVDADFTDNGNGSFTVTAPGRPGPWKVYLMARDGNGNIGIETTSIGVVPPQAGGTDIARGKATTASSFQDTGDGAPYLPSYATDGDPGTRWASDWSDPQWLRVDLGSVMSFDRVQLVWEASYARAYQVQTSDNGTDWTTVHEVTGGTGAVDTTDVSGTGRYVRVLGTERGTGWGYSLYGFGVYQD